MTYIWNYVIVLDKRGYQVNSYSSTKTYVVGTLAEALLMSTHKICFCREIRKI